ncbi:hypothetical protein U1Q18_036142 [Sarracenia purpurea var. burkii]
MYTYRSIILFLNGYYTAMTTMTMTKEVKREDYCSDYLQDKCDETCHAKCATAHPAVEEEPQGVCTENKGCACFYKCHDGNSGGSNGGSSGNTGFDGGLGFDSMKKRHYPIECIKFMYNMPMGAPCDSCQNDCARDTPNSTGHCYTRQQQWCQCEWIC